MAYCYTGLAHFRLGKFLSWKIVNFVMIDQAPAHYPAMTELLLINHIKSQVIHPSQCVPLANTYKSLEYGGTG